MLSLINQKPSNSFVFNKFKSLSYDLKSLLPINKDFYALTL